MFLEEMSFAAQLNHPSIATTYDFGEVDGVYYIAMELIEGLTLSAITHVLRALPPAETIAIARGLADALSYAHELKTPVVHCDLSPQNVMLSTRGAIKLLDFGIARAEAALSVGARGKVSYAAPEQIRGAAPDRRLDIWALGVMLYEALAGRRPFPQSEPVQVLKAAEAKNYLPLERLRPQLAAISPVIDRALDPDPRARFQDARAFADALSRAAKLSPAPPERLADLIQRAGGVKNLDEPEEMTGTGVAVVAAGALASPLPATSDVGLTVEPPKRRRFGMTALALVTGVIVLGAAVVNLASTFDAGEEPLTIALPLDPAPPPPVIAARHDAPELDEPIEAAFEEPAPPEKPARSKAGGRRAKARIAEREKTPGAKVEPKSEANGLGVLSVRTTPWAKVALDGKSLGEGVVAARPVPAGKHTLVLTPGDDRYAPKEVLIEIRVGIATKVFVDFETGAVRVDPS
jgi:serine/threonine-protein kinase